MKRRSKFREFGRRVLDWFGRKETTEPDEPEQEAEHDEAPKTVTQYLEMPVRTELEVRRFIDDGQLRCPECLSSMAKRIGKKRYPFKITSTWHCMRCEHRWTIDTRRGVKS